MNIVVKYKVFYIFFNKFFTYPFNFGKYIFISKYKKVKKVVENISLYTYIFDIV